MRGSIRSRKVCARPSARFATPISRPGRGRGGAGWCIWAPPHLAAIEGVLKPENWSGRIGVRSALDGRVINAGVPRYRQLASRHHDAIAAEQLGEDSILLHVETTQSRLRIAEAARTRVHAESVETVPDRELLQEAGYTGQAPAFEVAEGRAVTVGKIVALHTSRDRAISARNPACRGWSRAAGGAFRGPAGEPCTGMVASLAPTLLEIARFWRASPNGTRRATGTRSAASWARRVSRRLSLVGDTGPRQQCLHQRHGRLGARKEMLEFPCIREKGGTRPTEPAAEA